MLNEIKQYLETYEIPNIAVTDSAARPTRLLFTFSFPEITDLNTITYQCLLPISDLTALNQDPSSAFSSAKTVARAMQRFNYDTQSAILKQLPIELNISDTRLCSYYDRVVIISTVLALSDRRNMFEIGSPYPTPIWSRETPSISKTKLPLPVINTLVQLNSQIILTITPSSNTLELSSKCSKFTTPIPGPVTTKSIAETILTALNTLTKIANL